jgi:betaine/carnitine transporter, BCCT family
MPDPVKPNADGDVDWPVLIGSVSLLVALCTPLALYPEAGRRELGNAFDFLTQNFGVLYIVAGIFALLFLLFLAFGRHRHIVFAREKGPAQFSTFSWSAMLFCGGIGTSVLYWGTVEWAHYYLAPPFAIQAQSAQALPWAVSYPIFHWGLIGWAFYCLPGIAMGYVYYVRGATTLRLSEACAQVIPRILRRYTDPLLDLIFVVGLVGACSTGIGLAVPLIGTLSSDLLGLDPVKLGFGLDLIVIVIVTFLFAASAWLGLEGGIRRLSNLNVWLAFALMAFVLFSGPTLFIVELGVESLGLLVQNFVRMSTWTDAQASSDFVESWTVFYWAWWLALGPFMGIFIAKISRGRTMQQIILGCLGYGTLGCTLFFVVLGNYAAYLETNGIVDVLAQIDAGQAPRAILLVLQTLPLSSAVIFLFTIVCVIFAATSYDSASYVLATAATRNLSETAHPSRRHRVFWAVVLGLLPTTLIFMGGLRPLQSAVTLASVPLLIVMGLMSWSLWRSLSQDVGYKVE